MTTRESSVTTILRMLNLRRAAALLGASMALSGIIGLGIEGDKNDEATQKATTATTCLNSIPHEDTVNQPLLDCMSKGTPAGKPIPTEDGLKVGQPIGFVDGYVDAQQTEASQIEPGRVAGWCAVPLIVGGIIVAAAVGNRL